MINEIREDMRKVKRMVAEVEIIIGKREGEIGYANQLIDAENLLTYCMSRLENAIVLPCKVGTPVFIINKKGQIFPGKFRLDDIDQFGKRVFLTRSEAEAVLKPKNGGLTNESKDALLNSFMKGAEQ